MVEAICPKCDTVNHVGDELIGRYTICDRCRCRFYVEVPTLEQMPKPAASQIRESPTPTPETTLDDLLWDTQRGARFVMQALSEHRRLLQRTKWALLMLTVVAVANLACVLVILSR